MQKLIDFEKKVLNAGIPNFEIIDDTPFFKFDGQIFTLAIFNNDGFGIYVMNNKKQASRIYEVGCSDEMYESMIKRLPKFFENYQSKYSKLVMNQIYNNLSIFNSQFESAMKDLQ